MEVIVVVATVYNLPTCPSSLLHHISPQRRLLPATTPYTFYRADIYLAMAYYMQLPALSEVVPADILHDKRFAQFAPYSSAPLVSLYCHALH
jgi:hypothetical protein